MEIKKKLSDIEKAQAREKRREEIKKNHPELEQVPPNSYKERVVGAKNIKKELAKAFPGVKFSVRSQSFSGGDFIDIDWTDGPTEEMVKKITDKYQEGDFDGMEDIYRNNHENVWPEVFGGAKYVMEQRRDSGKLILKTAQNMYPKYELSETDLDKYGSLEQSAKLTREQCQDVYREARKTSCFELNA